jgi:hypothetical protein
MNSISMEAIEEVEQYYINRYENIEWCMFEILIFRTMHTNYLLNVCYIV